ncbi:hypothetical protein F5Y12DRAFT_730834 [Xylaria sp. FL1777]|nr:hypothetical protein F5Y12DRAFT_730834 [Xylaria sp. FL1777]
MNRLPQDIYDEIGALLRGPAFDRPALATISRQWQAAIERQTFRNIRVKSTDLDRFRETVQNDRRRYVNTIEYIIVLPAYDDEKRCRFERENDRHANNEVFTAAIYRLFHLLKSWDACKDGYIRLRLRDVYSCADHPFLRRTSPSFKVEISSSLRRDADNGNTVVDLWTWRFRYSYLRLLNPSELPMVPVIRTFVTCPMTRNICDRVPIDIAAKLPNLQRTSWVMRDWEIRYINLRRAHRHDLAQAVTEVLPRFPALQSLSLWMGSVYLWAPNFSLGTLNLDDSEFDTLSGAIRTATGNISTLKELVICGSFDWSLLWPGPAHALVEPYWQSLERLQVTFAMRRPSGGFYFRNPQPLSPPLETEVPPGYRHSEEEDVTAAMSFSVWEDRYPGNMHFELVPDDDSLVPLIEAFGQACLQMPELKSAQLFTVVPAPAELNANQSSRNRSLWGVWYFSPYTYPHTPPTIIDENMDPAFFEDVHHRRLFWNVRDWTPDMDLRRLLGNIGRERYGTYLVEKFFDA